MLGPSLPIHWLAQQHGPLLDAAATAKAMGFRTSDALRQARRDGRLAISMFRIPGRRGWFARTEAVVAWLDSAGEPASQLREDQR
jgi:hypothetical protein